MDSPQPLRVIAKISIAFTGFCGLTVVLRRTSGRLTQVRKFRLRILPVPSFITLFLTLLPELLDHSGLHADTAWHLVSSALTT